MRDILNDVLLRSVKTGWRVAWDLSDIVGLRRAVINVEEIQQIFENAQQYGENILMCYTDEILGFTGSQGQRSITIFNSFRQFSVRLFQKSVWRHSWISIQHSGVARSYSRGADDTVYGQHALPSLRNLLDGSSEMQSAKETYTMKPSEFSPPVLKFQAPFHLLSPQERSRPTLWLLEWRY